MVMGEGWSSDLSYNLSGDMVEVWAIHEGMSGRQVTKHMKQVR